MGLFTKKKKQQEAEPAPEKKVPTDILEQDFLSMYEICRQYTMTSAERMYALYNAVNYIIDNNIPGDFVECGVWKGGSALLMAMILSKRKVQDRKVVLYDTYEGMPPPTELDKSATGESAQSLLDQSSIADQSSVWCYSSFDEVRANMLTSELAEDLIVMVKGKVEDTIPSNVPTEQIALLRLDTDWYESTYHELQHLYPLLVKDGVLIIDDYGHWQGCRRAVDEYFEKNKVSLLLNRIDETGRFGIKNIT